MCENSSHKDEKHKRKLREQLRQPTDTFLQSAINCVQTIYEDYPQEETTESQIEKTNGKINEKALNSAIEEVKKKCKVNFHKDGEITCSFCKILHIFPKNIDNFKAIIRKKKQVRKVCTNSAINSDPFYFLDHKISLLNYTHTRTLSPLSLLSPLSSLLSPLSSLLSPLSSLLSPLSPLSSLLSPLSSLSSLLSLLSPLSL